MSKNLDYGNVGVWAILLLALSALTAKKVSQILDAKSDFKKKMLGIALAEQSRSGIHPDVTITQAAHESNWGLSGLTTKANNLFGFTGDSWEKEGKPVIRLETTEFVNGKNIKVLRPFRAYTSWAGSVRDWGDLISKSSRYKTAYDLAKKGDVPGFASAVAKAGYATDPAYEQKLVAVFAKVKSIPNEAVS